MSRGNFPSSSSFDAGRDTRASEVGAHAVGVYATAQHQGATAFLLKHGFSSLSTYTRMTVPETQPFAAPELPSGFAIRSYAQIQRMDLLVEAMNRSYQGLWGHHQMSQEDMADWLPHLHPEGIFLLLAPDGAVAGICRAELSEHLTELRGASTGFIDAPGVVPEYRDAGFYLPLVLTALQWLTPQKPATIELESWGDAAATLALYRTLGFTLMQEAISYRRSLA